MAELHISISAEPIAEIGGLTVTNSMLTSWLVSGLLIIFALWFHNQLKTIQFNDRPTNLQSIVELLIEGLYNFIQGVTGSLKKTRIFFPLIATFFIFIMFSNWSGLIPGVGTIGFRQSETEEVALHKDTPTEKSKAPKAPNEKVSVKTKFVPYFRGPTADINTTLALAIFSVLGIQYFGFKFLGLHYPNKFFNFKNPIEFFVGILELFLEFAKIFSFAFRLFGNIFAGEVLLTVMAFLLPLFAPMPFLLLELFVGFVQALVFSMLTLVFLNLATMHHGAEATAH